MDSCNHNLNYLFVLSLLLFMLLLSLFLLLSSLYFIILEFNMDIFYNSTVQHGYIF